MPTLYVENVPEEVYDALRSRARKRRRSIAAEVMSILEESVPTASELKARRAFLQKLKSLHHPAARESHHPSTQDMVREDRER
jgi:plasmid stability protein